jgi:hypothetical protein
MEPVEYQSAVGQRDNRLVLPLDRNILRHTWFASNVERSTLSRDEQDRDVREIVQER